MAYESFIASRLRLSGKGGGTATSIVMAVAGMSLAMVIMISALCIVTGFKHEIRRKVMGFDAHVSILAAGDNAAPDSGASVLSFSPQLRAIIDSTHMFNSSELVMEHPAVIKTDTDFEGIVLRGLTPGPGVDFITGSVTDGSWHVDSIDTNSMAISRTTADKLHLSTGDRVFMYFFTDEGVRTRRLSIAAIYDTHFSDYDNVYAFAPISLLQGVNALDSIQGNRIDLYLHDTSDIDASALKLQEAMMKEAWAGNLDGLYRISTVTSSGMMYFNWLALLDTNVVVILILMALVSGFTLVSSLFIIILERVRMIGILKAMGASNASVRRIFSLLGRRLVLYGMLTGNIIGLSLMFLQCRFHIIPLNPEAYYLDFVPVEIDIWQIVALNIGVFLVAWCVLLIPGRLIASVSPAKSMRYE
ncbi:FtsX-like permease family protein [uncultured Muribaculum sp.]|uniref:ABC transporter permease n=1 Tax=uncultured Muribaculum sp. TaxID=1918613 RepID=UPI0025D804B3|nr:FtsX-like permease family protein [uncultured Muribaculum sp.]